MRAATRHERVEALVRRIKCDVRDFIREGEISFTVSSFPELHNYVDANTLGDTEAIAEDMEWTEFIDACNDAFDQIDAWLKEGRPA